MKEKEFSVIKFLENNQISPSCYEDKENINTYIAEMQQGLDGSSSMSMLPTFIEEGNELPVNKPVLVLDAGGTNFRAALVSFSEEREVQISRFRKRGMPGFKHEHSRQEFFNAIADFIYDLAADVDRIGFCFSYPMKKMSDKDGRLMGFSKEIKAEEVVGEMIGAGVIEALAKKGIKNIRKIVLLNDTVATLLAGKAESKSDKYDTYIGLIYGTGFNASYNEHNEKIGKVEDLPAGESQLINMEAGSCAVMPSGDIDLLYRNTTARPDTYIFEKMVSGGYIGSLWMFILEKAAEEGCFSDSFRTALEAASESGCTSDCNASDLSRFLADGIFPEAIEGRADKSDLDRAMELSRAITARASYLAAAAITGIMLKTGKGKDKQRPVCLCVDGTTFWKLHGLKEKLISQLDIFTAEAGVYYEILQIENAPIIGAAVAGLTNS
ncbi:MAG TPA: hexokinase [Spirochaeta sp.]|nr:hexokinase [Spirochaeta sp.]